MWKDKNENNRKRRQSYYYKNLPILVKSDIFNYFAEKNSFKNDDATMREEETDQVNRNIINNVSTIY